MPQVALRHVPPCHLTSRPVLVLLALQAGLVHLGMALALVAQAATGSRWSEALFMMFYFATLYLPSLAATTQRGAVLVVPIYSMSHMLVTVFDLCLGLDLWRGFTPAVVCELVQARTELVVDFLYSLSGQPVRPQHT